MRISTTTIEHVHVSIATRNSTTPTQIFDNHFHQYYELYYCHFSTCTYFVEHRLLELREGDFLLIPPRKMHYTKYLSDTPCTRFCIYFTYEDIVDTSLFTPKDFSTFLTSHEIFHVPQAHRAIFYHHLQMMLAEESQEDTYRNTYLQLSLKQLFLLCLRFCIFNQPRHALTSAIDAKILEAAKYVSKHYATPLTLESISEKYGLSYTYFSKKFKSLTGIGFKEYVSFIRLKQATRALENKNCSISEIATSCGFHDSNYFKDAFKKMYGISPRAYRKAYHIAKEE